MEYLTGTKSSTTTLIITGILSSIIGGLIVYYLLKSRLNITQPLSFSSNIPSNIENRLNNIEQKLPQQNSNNLYKNDESWELIRGKDGFVSKLKALRDVKLNK